MHHRMGGRAMEAMMEEAIEQAYIEEGLDVSAACFQVYGHIIRPSAGPHCMGVSNAFLGFLHVL